MKTGFLLTTLLAVPILCFSAEEILDPKADKVPKIEVTDSMLGFRDTLEFYVFEGKKAVLRLRIGNENTKFPISAKLYVFPDDTSTEGMEKWINNQHSDGLFIDAAEPEASHDIPPAACVVKSHEAGGEVEGPLSGKFTRYNVTFEVKDVPAFGELKIKNFTDKATVFVKIGEK